MVSKASQAIAEPARELYESRMRPQLERDHSNWYVCIEPVSGSHFVAETFDDAVNAAIDSCPDRPTHTLRIGHTAALHLRGAV